MGTGRWELGSGKWEPGTGGAGVGSCGFGSGEGGREVGRVEGQGSGVRGQGSRMMGWREVGGRTRRGWKASPTCVAWSGRGGRGGGDGGKACRRDGAAGGCKGGQAAVAGLRSAFGACGGRPRCEQCACFAAGEVRVEVAGGMEGVAYGDGVRWGAGCGEGCGGIAESRCRSFDKISNCLEGQGVRRLASRSGVGPWR